MKNYDIYKNLLLNKKKITYDLDILKNKLDNYTKKKLFIVTSETAIISNGGGFRAAKCATHLVNLGYFVIYMFVYIAPHNLMVNLDINHELFGYYILRNNPINKIKNLLGGLDIKYIHLSPTKQVVDLHKNFNNKFIYDLRDNWKGGMGSKWYDSENEDWLIKNADKLTASSQYFIDINPSLEMELISNGYNDLYFNKNKTFERPKDMPKDGKVIIYFGSLMCSWIDYNLIKYIGENVNASILLIGNYNTRFMRKAKLKNIFFLGQKENNLIPNYLYYSDVGIMPFRITKTSSCSNSNKLFEYLSLDKPVVLTNIKYATEFNNAYKSKNYKEFLDNVKYCLSDSFEFKYESKIKEYAWSNLVKGYLTLG